MKHEPFPDDGVTYCGWWTGTQVIDGCGQVWPCSYERARREGRAQPRRDQEMAQRVEDFSFTRRGHNFEQYADGAAWVLEAGKDYTSKPGSVVTAARKWGKDNGYQVETEIIQADADTVEGLALRFTKQPTEEQPAAQPF